MSGCGDLAIDFEASCELVTVLEFEVELNLKVQVDQRIAEKLIIQNRSSLGSVVVELQQLGIWVWQQVHRIEN